MIRAVIFDLDGTLVQTEKLKAISYGRAVVELCPETIDEADPDVLRSNQWPHNRLLLKQARQANCQLGLATMSHCQQVQRVLAVLDLVNVFDFIATRDDVEHGKPHPEIYELVSSALAIPPGECLVIEDSPAGVQAALSAGMSCIAVTTPFTRGRIHASELLDERWIVDDPEALPAVVEMVMANGK
ncbi:MAG: HAD-IA family hydrolase [Anaerolineales bacterium]|jgi:HAD superfamily hydrolase (TIGR01509 family)